jgi:hypothetical protein
MALHMCKRQAIVSHMTTHSEPAMTKSDLIEELGVHARLLQPRLFAVYGCYRGALDPFLGWGMEFSDENQALFYTPDSKEIWQSTSAQQVLTTHRRLGDAQLTWLGQT